MKQYLNNTNRKFQCCKNYVMDTTDSKIEFDKNGVCDFGMISKTIFFQTGSPWKKAPNLKELQQKYERRGKVNSTTV